jgi:serine/threonine protein kinase
VRVSAWADFQGRKIPKEFEMHLLAQSVPGVIQIFDWYERKSSFVLIMEKPTSTIDLFELSRTRGALGENPTKIIFREIVKTFSALQTAGVLHRDIKDENILVNTLTLETKIIDFGCATEIREGFYEDISGTPEYFPPEIFIENQYEAESSTVWALGTLLHVLLIGDIPFESTKDIPLKKFQDLVINF